MSRPRRRVFGPLFYSSLIITVLVGGYSVVLRLGSMLSEWHEVRSLGQMLRAADPRTREMAATLLERQGAEISTPLLLDLARDARGEVRALACRSLVMGSTDASIVVPVLAAAASDDQEEVRREAAHSLGRVGWLAAMGSRSSAGAPGLLVAALRAESVRALRRLLKDRSSAVRTAAAEALAELGPDPEAAADLIAATDDLDRAVRFAASVALLKVNGRTDGAATRALVALVADPDGVPDRPAIFEVLKRASVDVQNQAVDALVALLAHGDPSVFADVITCVSAAGPRARAALPALEGLFDGDDPGLRSSAGLAIVAIEGQESPRSIATLIRMIADPTLPQDGRESAIPLLRGVNSAALARATPDLIRQLGDGNAEVRQHAVSLLSMIIDDTRALIPVPTSTK
jgi:HEAT repeat protein